jgi:uncharacterized membrane protein
MHRCEPIPSHRGERTASRFLGTGPAHAYLAVIPQRQRQRMNVKNILRIGLLLIVAWIVLKIVFNVVGFLFHLLLIAGVLFVIYYIVTNVLGKGKPRGY